jgi:thiol-disulfide isomerase/thioredoxin
MEAMSKRPLLSIILLVAAFSLSAATPNIPVLKAGPETYRDVSIIGANATDLYFTHEKGIGNVKLKYLSPELQKQFHYDPKAAAEAERKQTEAEALYHSAVASNLTMQARKVLSADAAATNEVVSLADPVSDKSLLGKKAPALEVGKWLDEAPALEDKYVLVLFWAPWSSASRQCIPELNGLQKKFSKQLAIVGITPTEELEESPKPEFACAADSKSKLSIASGVTSIPSALLIDSKGIVCYQGHPAAITEKKLEAILTRPVE